MSLVPGRTSCRIYCRWY